MKLVYDYEFGDTYIPSARIYIVKTKNGDHIITFEQHLLDDSHMMQLSLGVDVQLIAQKNMDFWTDENGFTCKRERLLVRNGLNVPPEDLFQLK